MVSSGRVQIFYNHKLVSLNQQSSNSSGPSQVLLELRGKNGPHLVSANSVILNLPQLPLLRVLGAPSSPFVPPSALFAPTTHAIMKLYIYYEDAWWRNYLNLTSGNFD